MACWRRRIDNFCREVFLEDILRCDWKPRGSSQMLPVMVRGFRYPQLLSSLPSTSQHLSFPGCISSSFPSPIHPSRVHTMQGFHGAVDDHLVYLVDLVFFAKKSRHKKTETPKKPMKSLIHDEIPNKTHTKNRSDFLICVF